MDSTSIVPPIETPLTAPTLPPRAADPYRALSYCDLPQAPEGTGDWVWHGYLRRRSVTLLTSLWKTGKSTLLGVLLSRLKSGGELGGFAVQPGRAIVVSEEAPEMWWERGRDVDLDGHVQWFCKPFQGRPTSHQWLDLLDQIGRIHDQEPVSLVAIDSLANLAPMRTENDAMAILSAVSPLERLTQRGISVLLCHHPKKGTVIPGQAARGNGALTAFVDIIVEMQGVGRGRGRARDRRRRLRGYSRHAATPPSWIIEWTADGKDYVGLALATELSYERGWPALKSLLESADNFLTRKAILHPWPETEALPSRATLWKWLNQAVGDGAVEVTGEGTRKDPFRYALNGMRDIWCQRDLAALNRSLGLPEDYGMPQGASTENPA